MQLTPDLFYTMTFEELLIMRDGKIEHDDIDRRMGWEQARMIAYKLSAPYFKKGQVPSITAFHKLPWDDEINQQRQELNMELYEAAKAEYLKELKKHKMKIA